MKGYFVSLCNGSQILQRIIKDLSKCACLSSGAFSFAVNMLVYVC